MSEKRGPYKLDEKNEFCEVYKRKACNVTAACDAVGISRETYYEWRRNDKEFDQKCKEIEESLIDLAEVQLIKNIREGNQRAVEFFLKNRAAERWKDKREQEITGEGLKVEFAIKDFSKEKK